MATGSHVGSNAEVHRLKQAQTHDLLKRMVCSGDEKNMKEVDYSLKDETDQERFPVGRCVHKYSKAKRVVVSKKKTRHSGVGSRACRRSPTASRTSDMANKENELTCADDVQAILYSDNCGFPVNSTDASKMAGAGSKYSDYFTELLEDHEAMTHVLFGRNLRLNVALTLWRKNASELVAYLNRIQDTGVLVDCLPVLTKSLQEEQPCISIGCCVDLLPQVKMILNTKYEEHLIVALHWVQSIIKKWWSELSTNNKSLHDGFSNDSRNVQAMKTALLELWEGKRHLSSVPGTVGETAKIIESYVSQLR
ncbi:KATNB1-like protein 1 isoform X3 [Sinocyclocheilus rhinocerous]|uniref:KATNB1-like protein 1 isoform X3 n=1 Tax=Sinocyclocheilus rhinocerous TaxID=307959 RepID=UPI0007B99861|nr:PREDICTED: KATNB1-like protein 1 isoform X3 [Sinocyclocheilus rhinocerous]